MRIVNDFLHNFVRVSFRRLQLFVDDNRKPLSLWQKIKRIYPPLKTPCAFDVYQLLPYTLHLLSQTSSFAFAWIKCFTILFDAVLKLGALSNLLSPMHALGPWSSDHPIELSVRSIVVGKFSLCKCINPKKEFSSRVL